MRSSCAKLPLAFSPDGRWLASGSADAKIRLWNAEKLNASPTLLNGQVGPVTTLAFSPDGRWLASGSADAKIRLWDIQIPEADSSELIGIERSGAIQAYSPDGHWLASTSADNILSLWPIDPHELIIIACHITGQGLADKEFRQYIPDEEPYDLCESLRGVK